MAWVDELVIGRGLCPWASEAIAASGLHLRAVPSVDAVQQVAMEEAESLLASTLRRPTTLLVVDADVAVADFAHVARNIQERLLSTDVDVLAFHPTRMDSGPGCTDDPNDAAHYAVRSPLPTLQLLRRGDLTRARGDWKKSHDSPLPGALGLLHENKRRLRRLGPDVLAQLLRGWRQTWTQGVHEGEGQAENIMLGKWQAKS